MTEVQIQSIQPEGERVLALLQQFRSLHDEIRSRAFVMFESRGRVHGHDTEDWMAAQRSVVLTPSAELIDRGGQLEIRVDTPGFRSQEIRVSVLSNEVIVDGNASTSAWVRTPVCFGESQGLKLFCRISLPQGLRPDSVKATVEDGVLRINLKKVSQDRGTNGSINGMPDFKRRGGYKGASHPVLAVGWRSCRRSELRFAALEAVRTARLQIRIPGRRIPVR
jgi:HSP20 family molecular chaperone IbpA